MTPIKVGGSKTLPPLHLVLDKAGELVYYRFLDAGKNTSDFKRHNKGYVSYSYNNKYYIEDESFCLIDSIWPKTFGFDAHDLLILDNGHLLLFGVEEIRTNLSNYHLFNKNGSAGSDTASLKSNVILELDKNKAIVFEWHATDHYKFDDIDTSYLNNCNKVDWCHFNAIAIDKDGNLLVSARNFNEITKINRRTGDIIWRFGGKRNQFVVEDSAGFLAMHDIRLLKNGHITLLDNGARGHPTQAKEYALNEKKLSAKLVWSYTDNPNSESKKGIGNVHRLQNGNTLINYGISSNSLPMFSVVNQKKTKLFEIVFKDTLRSYRVFNYTELPPLWKRPTIHYFKKDGIAYLDAGSSWKSYKWSTGETTQVIKLSKNGSYKVFTPTPNGGFISSTPYVMKDF